MAAMALEPGLARAVQVCAIATVLMHKTRLSKHNCACRFLCSRIRLNTVYYCIYDALRESNTNSRPVPLAEGSVTDVEDVIFRSHTLAELEGELKKKGPFKKVTACLHYY